MQRCGAWPLQIRALNWRACLGRFHVFFGMFRHALVTQKNPSLASFFNSSYEYDDEALDVDRRNRDFGVDGRIKDKGAPPQQQPSAAATSNADRSQNRRGGSGTPATTSHPAPSNPAASASASTSSSLRNQPGMVGSSASAARKEVHDDEPACNARPPGLPAPSSSSSSSSSSSGRNQQPVAASSGAGKGKAAKEPIPAAAATSSAEALSGPGRPLSAAAAPFRMSATAAPFSASSSAASAPASSAAAVTQKSNEAQTSAAEVSVPPALLARMHRPSAQNNHCWHLVERVDRALSRLVFGGSKAGETVAARIERETGAAVRVPPSAGSDAGSPQPEEEEDGMDDVEIAAASAAQVSAAKLQCVFLLDLRFLRLVAVSVPPSLDFSKRFPFHCSCFFRIDSLVESAIASLDYTHFLSIPLALSASSGETRAHVDRFHRAALAALPTCRGLDASLLVPAAHLHLTVAMLKLWSPARVRAAVAALAAAAPRMYDATGTTTLRVRVRGAAVMGEEEDEAEDASGSGSSAGAARLRKAEHAHVVYAQIEENSAKQTLRRVARLAIEAFARAGLLDADEMDKQLLTDDAAFQWHATLINTRYRAEKSAVVSASEVATAGKDAHSSPPARRRRVSFDASSLLDGGGGLRSFDFGLAHLPGVHLSRRFPAPAGDAYYQHEALAPLP